MPAPRRHWRQPLLRTLRSTQHAARRTRTQPSLPRGGHCRLRERSERRPLPAAAARGLPGAHGAHARERRGGLAPTRRGGRGAPLVAAVARRVKAARAASQAVGCGAVPGAGGAGAPFASVSAVSRPGAAPRARPLAGAAPVQIKTGHSAAARPALCLRVVAAAPCAAELRSQARRRLRRAPPELPFSPRCAIPPGSWYLKMR